MKKKALFLVLALWMSWIGCYADEGMWIPHVVEEIQYRRHAKRGVQTDRRRYLRY